MSVANGFEKLLISIVNRKQGEKLVACQRAAGAKGATIINARGTATNKILEFLAIGDSEKELVVALLGEDFQKIIDAQLDFARKNPKQFAGVAALVDLKQSEESKMSEFKMISTIVNSGFADEAMAAARKAGAFGGTVISARGTGTADDAKFFGITLVPEKELLIILAKAEQEGAILDAIRSCKSLSAPGSGITYSVSVEKFYNLGK